MSGSNADHDRRLDVKREMDAADVSHVLRLLDAAARVDGRRPLSDHLYLDLVNGGADGFTGILAWEPDSDLPVAYAQLSRGNDEYLLEVILHPRLRDHTATVVPELIDAALDVIASAGGGVVSWWVFEPTATDRELAAAAGMHEARRLHQMRRSLPTGVPVTIETRPFVPGADDEAWLAVNNRAFADHREQGGWTIDTLRRRQGETWFDPDGFRIHERDGRMAGFCWTKVHPPEGDDEAKGEIYVIAVDPAFHGLGLGKQLTLAGLQWLAGRGITTGFLYVDADNTALTMYERLGFEIHSTNAAFQVDVAAAPSADALVRTGPAPTPPR